MFGLFEVYFELSSVVSSCFLSEEKRREVGQTLDRLAENIRSDFMVLPFLRSFYFDFNSTYQTVVDFPSHQSLIYFF